MKRGYKQTEVGIIPDEWDVRSFGSLFSFSNGVNADKRSYGKGFRFVNVLEPITFSHLHGPEILGRVDLPASVAAAYAVKLGDVLFNRTSETDDELALAATYLGDEHVVFGGFVIRGRPIDDSLDPTYSGYALRAPIIRSQIIPMGQGAVRANIGQRNLRRVLAPVPPRSEQLAVAAALHDVDGLLDGLGRLIAKKRDLKQATMQQLLTGQTRLPGFHGVWDVKELRQIVQTPITDGPHLTPRFFESGIPFLSVNNLVDNGIDFSDPRFISPADHDLFSRKCKPRKGDILLGKAASVGKVAIVETDMDFNIWSPIAMIRVSDSHDPRFIYYQLQCSDVVRQIKLLTNSSSQGNIGMGDIELLRLALPCLPEQSAIAAVLSEIDTELLALSSRLDKTHALKQAMMQELLTGKTRLVPIGDASCLNNPAPSAIRRTA